MSEMIPPGLKWMSMQANIVLLPGDGIGPEVVAEAVRVLDTIANKHGHTFYLHRAADGRLFD